MWWHGGGERCPAARSASPTSSSTATTSTWARRSTVPSAGPEVLQRLALVLVHLEDRQQARQVQRGVHALRGVEELEGRSRALRGAQARHQLAHAGAVHEGDLGEVDQDLALALGQQAFQRLA